MSVRNPHIAFFSGDITRSGGTERVGSAIANALAGGHAPGTPATGATQSRRVSVISLFEEHDRPAYPLEPTIARFTLYPRPAHGVWRYPVTCTRLLRMVRRERIDVLIDIDGILDMYALPVRRLTGVRVVSWEHFNMMTNPGVPYRRITRPWAARSADAIVTLTETDRRMVEHSVGKHRPIVRCIPNPMPDIEPTAEVEPVANVVSTPGGEPHIAYDADSRIILSAGRLTAQKGFDLLVEVAARVLPDHPGWRWLIAGEGEERAMLERRIARAGLRDRVVLLGRIDDMDGLYRRAAVFVLTSRYEGLPMVLLEAKARRLPIVGFDCPTGPADIVTDGVNGDLVPAGDVPAMAARLGRLLDDPVRRRRYAGHALDGAARFDRATIVAQWERLLEDLR
ncbi:glycosyltransferase family 4 protein [Bifidobacterium simiarum]|uniref:glycosyltransferase family 4 protein n=1 Tax=Bifidobacterium simiarum TaxID=2045441 RepID=UPI001BDC322B|nr:glycosyltransferase family 4 protein [Bifidobacterium simiarum]MBT1165724.1 glycosyltransferase family 4 protein [Bifidobacterium simiarum]